MLSELLESWKARRSIKELERHPIYKLVLLYVRSVFNDKSQGIDQHWSEDGKRKLVITLIEDLQRVLALPNPAQAIRMRAIEFMLIAAQFDVLIMQPPGPFKGLSGELKSHIATLGKKNKYLEEFFYGINPTPTTFDEFWDAALSRYWATHLYMNAYNQARLALGDYNADKSKDWFLPCYTSLCIWQESIYRDE